MAACEWWDLLCHANELGKALFGWGEDLASDLFERVVAILMAFWLAVFNALVEGILWLGQQIASALEWVILTPVRGFQAFLTSMADLFRGLGLAAPVAASLVFVLVALLTVLIAVAVRFAAERIWELL